MFETIHDLSTISGGVTQDPNTGRTCTDPRPTGRPPLDGTVGGPLGPIFGGPIGPILGGGGPLGFPGKSIGNFPGDRRWDMLNQRNR